MIRDTDLDQLLGEAIQVPAAGGQKPITVCEILTDWDEAEETLAGAANDSMEVENDGVGDYEAWGHKGNDTGQDFPSITADDLWIGFTPEAINAKLQERGETFDPSFGVDQLDGMEFSGVCNAESGPPPGEEDGMPEGQTSCKWAARPVEVRQMDLGDGTGPFYAVRFEINQEDSAV